MTNFPIIHPEIPWREKLRLLGQLCGPAYNLHIKQTPNQIPEFEIVTNVEVWINQEGPKSNYLAYGNGDTEEEAIQALWRMLQHQIDYNRSLQPRTYQFCRKERAFDNPDTVLRHFFYFDPVTKSWMFYFTQSTLEPAQTKAPQSEAAGG